MAHNYARLSRRRVIIALAALAVYGGATGRAAAAQAVRIVVGTDPGGTLDISARAFAEQLRQYQGGTVEVENDGGGGGRFALAAAYEAAGNAGVITFVPGSMVYNALADDELATQFAAVQFLGSLGRDQRLLFVTAKTGLTSFAEVRAGKMALTVATPRATSASHFETLLINAVAGTRIKPVGGYGSAGRKIALLSGEVNAAVGSYDTFADLIADGTLIPVLALNTPVAGSPVAGLPVLADFADTEAKRRVVEMVAVAAESDQMVVVPPGIGESEFVALEAAFIACAPKVTAALRASSTGGAALPNDTEALRAGFARVFADRTTYGATLKAAAACGASLGDGQDCSFP